MPETSHFHGQAQVGELHAEGRPFHFSALSQDDRLRKVFGLPEDAPIPPVREDSLAAYFLYLRDNISLPFEALYCRNGSEMRQLVHYVKVTGLIDPRTMRSRNIHGLYCRAENNTESIEAPLAEFGVREDHPNCQLIDDYAYWYVNWR
jgi:hypothetical protein